MDHKQNLSGVFAPITTPFFADGTIDFDGLKRNMERYAKSPLKGYLALGSNGENKSMLTEEKLRVLEIIVKNKGAHQVVMTGCIAESTFETIGIAKEACAIGTDYVTLLSPNYFKKQMTDAALLKYFTDVADSVDKPCLAYCAPQFTGGITLSNSLVKQLAAHPNIVGMKDSHRQYRRLPDGRARGLLRDGGFGELLFKRAHRRRNRRGHLAGNRVSGHHGQALRPVQGGGLRSQLCAQPRNPAAQRRRFRQGRRRGGEVCNGPCGLCGRIPASAAVAA